MGGTMRDALVRALEDLSERDLKKFCNKIRDMPIKRGFNQIPLSKWEHRDAEEVVAVIRDFYGDQYGAQLTVDVLNAINQKTVAIELEENLAKAAPFMPASKHKKLHFVDKHREALIQEVKLTGPVLDILLSADLLNKEEYGSIQAMKTSQERMRKLYAATRCWKEQDKDILFDALMKYNSHVIKHLEQKCPEYIVIQFLDKLSQSQFEKFKHELSELCKDSHPIPQRLQQSADRTTTAELLIVIYRKEEALTMATQILKRIEETDLAAKLQNWYSLLDSQGEKKKVGTSKLTAKGSDPQTGADTLPSMGACCKEDTQNDWEAPSYVRMEMMCPICWEILTDPTTLSCGHNFCMGCIEKTWKNQDKGESSCPNCQRRFKILPKLEINRSVREVALYLKSTKSKPRTSDLHCTYCLQSPVAAIKSCLWCESSLCDAHLSVHSQEPAHIIVEPTADFKRRKCLLHNKILDFYCQEDATCICSSCAISKEHRGHQVEEAKTASMSKKKTLQQDQIKLKDKIGMLGECLERWNEIQKYSTMEAMTSPYEKLMKQLLEALELPVPEEDLSQSAVSDLIKKAEETRRKLSLHMESIEDRCQENDPFLVLEPRVNSIL